jgi:hypothetical protein
MLLDVALIADLLTVQHHRQALVDVNLLCHNARRRDDHYRVGDSELAKAVDSVKLAPRAHGPFPIYKCTPMKQVMFKRHPTSLKGSAYEDWCRFHKSVLVYRIHYLSLSL